MDFIEALQEETRLKIWLLLLQEKELIVTDIAEKLNLSQPTISQHLAILESAKAIKTKYVKRRGVAKLCYPSWQGMFEEMAKLKGVILSTKDYEKLDNLMLYDKFKELYLKELEKKKQETNPILAIITVFITIFSQILTSKDLLKDVHFIELLKEVDPIIKRLFPQLSEIKLLKT